MREELYKWWRKDKLNIILTVSVGLLPIIMEWGIKFLNSPIRQGFFHILWSLYTGIKIDSSANYFIQTVFIIVTLYVLISNRRKAFADLSESECQIKQYIARNCNIKIYKDTLDQCYAIVKGTVRQFYFVWLIVWFIWLIYYLGNLLLVKLCEPIQIYSQTFDFLNSSAMFVIYLILTNVTVNLKKRLKNDNSFWYGFFVWVAVLTIWIISICIAETGCIEAKEAYHFASILLSLFSSMSFVLVLGKINSNYLQIPRIFLFGLYTYAIIQAYVPFVEYEKYPEIMKFLSSTIAYVTIIGKICLMLTLCWIVNQKRLIFFVIHKSVSIDEAPKWLNDLNKEPVSF